MDSIPRRPRGQSYGDIPGSPRPSRVQFEDDEDRPRASSRNLRNRGDIPFAFDLSSVDDEKVFVPDVDVGSEHELNENRGKSTLMAMSANAYYPDYNVKDYIDDISRIDNMIRPLAMFEEELKCTIIGEDFGTVSDLSIEELIKLIKDVIKARGLKRIQQLNPFWIDFVCASPTDITLLEELFELHPLTGYDCIATEIREKWESFPNYLFLVIHEIGMDTRASWLHLVPLRIVLFDYCILTFHSVKLKSVNETIDRVHLNSSVLRSVDWCFFLLLKSLITIFELHVGSITSEMVSIDELILVLVSSAEDHDDLLKRIRNANSQLSSLYWMMCIKQEIMLSICSRRRLHISSSTQLFMRSLLDSVIRMRFDLQVGRESLDASHSTFLAMVSIQNAQTANRTNDLMKKISSVATVLLPLTIIVGLFGMNVKVPGQYVDNYDWFICICATIVILAIINVYYFRRRNLI